MKLCQLKFNFFLFSTFLFLFVSCGQDDGNVFTKVYVYQSDTTYNAQTMPSRTVTTNTCQTDFQANNSTWEISCNNFVAFVGYSSDNGVLNFPSSYGLPTSVNFLGVDETFFAHDWNDFITDIDVGLTGTGFSSVISWTGIANGGALSNNCNDWTSTLNSVDAIRSQINSGGAVWNNGSWACDTATANLPLICLCW